MPDVLVISIILAFACGVIFSFLCILALDAYTDSEIIDALVREGFTREDARKLLNRIKAMGEKKEVMP